MDTPSGTPEKGKEKESERLWPQVEGVDEEHDRALEEVAKGLAKGEWPTAYEDHARRAWHGYAMALSRKPFTPSRNLNIWTNLPEAMVALADHPPPGHEELFVDEVKSMGAKKALRRLGQRSLMLLENIDFVKMMGAGILHLYSRGRAQSLLGALGDKGATGPLVGRERQDVIDKWYREGVVLFRLRSDVLEQLTDPTALPLYVEFVKLRRGRLRLGRYRASLDNMYMMLADVRMTYKIKFVVAAGGKRVGTLPHLYRRTRLEVGFLDILWAEWDRDKIRRVIEKRRRGGPRRWYWEAYWHAVRRGALN